MKCCSALRGLLTTTVSRAWVRTHQKEHPPPPRRLSYSGPCHSMRCRGCPSIMWVYVNDGIRLTVHSDTVGPVQLNLEDACSQACGLVLLFSVVFFFPMEGLGRCHESPHAVLGSNPQRLKISRAALQMMAASPQPPNRFFFFFFNLVWIYLTTDGGFGENSSPPGRSVCFVASARDGTSNVTNTAI